MKVREVLVVGSFGPCGGTLLQRINKFKDMFFYMRQSSECPFKNMHFFLVLDIKNIKEMRFHMLQTRGS